MSLIGILIIICPVYFIILMNKKLIMLAWMKRVVGSEGDILHIKASRTGLYFDEE